MKCPICKKKAPRKSPHRPFCSERCRIIDLGNWATQKYVISTPFSQEEELGEETPDGNGEIVDPRG